MTVDELRDLIKDLPGDLEVVTPRQGSWKHINNGFIGYHDDFIKMNKYFVLNYDFFKKPFKSEHL